MQVNFPVFSTILFHIFLHRLVISLLIADLIHGLSGSLSYVASIYHQDWLLLMVLPLVDPQGFIHIRNLSIYDWVSYHTAISSQKLTNNRFSLFPSYRILSFLMIIQSFSFLQNTIMRFRLLLSEEIFSRKYLNP